LGEWSQQTVYDLAEKNDSSLDLIEKHLGENDLVYELTATGSVYPWPIPSLMDSLQDMIDAFAGFRRTVKLAVKLSHLVAPNPRPAKIGEGYRVAW
jgi:hypothetical protein